MGLRNGKRIDDNTMTIEDKLAEIDSRLTDIENSVRSVTTYIRTTTDDIHAKIAQPASTGKDPAAGMIQQSLDQLTTRIADIERVPVGKGGDRELSKRIESIETQMKARDEDLDRKISSIVTGLQGDIHSGRRLQPNEARIDTMQQTISQKDMDELHDIIRVIAERLTELEKKQASSNDAVQDLDYVIKTVVQRLAALEERTSKADDKTGVKALSERISVLEAAHSVAKNDVQAVQVRDIQAILQGVTKRIGSL